MSDSGRVGDILFPEKNRYRPRQKKNKNENLGALVPYRI